MFRGTIEVAGRWVHGQAWAIFSVGCATAVRLCERHLEPSTTREDRKTTITKNKDMLQSEFRLSKLQNEFRNSKGMPMVIMSGDRADCMGVFSLGGLLLFTFTHVSSQRSIFTCSKFLPNSLLHLASFVS